MTAAPNGAAYYKFFVARKIARCPESMQLFFLREVRASSLCAVALLTACRRSSV